MRTWVYNPHSGGVKIPDTERAILSKQVKTFSKKRPWSDSVELQLRFKNQFCYIDSVEVGDTRTLPVARLRYGRDKLFSLAIYTYSHDRYDPSIFRTGEQKGTFEEALLICEHFLL